MLDQDNSFYLISFKYPNFFIQHPGCLFTYDISREGTYSKQGADQGKGAYFFFGNKAECAKQSADVSLKRIKRLETGLVFPWIFSLLQILKTKLFV